jgi:hypothetical protein
MALSIVNLKNPQELMKMGTEYVCTGFMFDVPETNKSLQEQMASFDFIGVEMPDDRYRRHVPNDDEGGFY